MEEIWKSIDGFEGFYEVSNHGRVKSLSRTVEGLFGRKTFKERILSTPLDYYGYSICGLYKNGTNKCTSVHRLVAQSFLGHNHKKTGLVIDHIDGDKSNNNVSNLRLVTVRFNVTYGVTKNTRNRTSKYPGVSLSAKKTRWQSIIFIDGKSKFIGSFINEVDAAKAYEKELLKLNTDTP